MLFYKNNINNTIIKCKNKYNYIKNLYYNLKSINKDEYFNLKKKNINYIINFIINSLKSCNNIYYQLNEYKKNILSLIVYFSENEYDVKYLKEFKNDANINFLIQFTRICNLFELRNLYYIFLLSTPHIYKSKEEENETIKNLNMKIDFIIENILNYKNLLFNNNDKISDFVDCFKNNIYTYSLCYLGINLVNYCKKYSRMCRLIYPKLNYKTNKLINKNKKRKIKIAYISSLLFSSPNHSVARDRIGIISNMDKSKFDIYVIGFIDYKKKGSLFINNIESIDSNIKQIILGENINDNIKIIENINLDIIIYCEIGMCSNNYNLALLRLAPIQCNTYGHSHTSGIDTIDYFITSKYFECSDSIINENYSEKVILSNSLSTYYYNPLIVENFKSDYSRISKYNIDLDNNIYFCLQTISKISIEFDEVIKNILEKDKKSIILLSNSFNLGKSLYNRLVKKINDKDIHRIIMIDSVDRLTYLELMNISDVVLDTYPFGGFNSTIEALCLNKPVITLPGKFINGRFTYGLYLKMGILDLVSENINDYINLCLKCTSDIKWLNIIKNKIESNLNKILEDKESSIEWDNKLIELFENYIDNLK